MLGLKLNHVSKRGHRGLCPSSALLQTEYDNDIIHNRHAISNGHGGWSINTLMEERNDHQFADAFLEFILMNEND